MLALLLTFVAGQVVGLVIALIACGAVIAVMKGDDSDVDDAS